MLPTGLVDWKKINQQSSAVLRELGLNVSPTQRVEYLSVADKQLVRSPRRCHGDFRVLVMDEPTAALNAAEVERLFEIIAELRTRNIAILYVSHRLGEVFRIADRVTVLHNGKKVGTRTMENLAESNVIAMMLGRALQPRSAEPAARAGQGAVAIHVADLSLPGALNGVSFELGYGEVLGCAGLIGSGRSELVRVLFGLAPRWKGEIRVDARPVTLRSPREALAQGIFMLTEDRKAEGIFPDLAVGENILIHSAGEDAGKGGGPWQSGPPEQPVPDSGRCGARQVREIKEFLAIHAHSAHQLISTLSGGNQQKAIFGHALVSH